MPHFPIVRYGLILFSTSISYRLITADICAHIVEQFLSSAHYIMHELTSGKTNSRSDTGTSFASFYIPAHAASLFPERWRSSRLYFTARMGMHLVQSLLRLSCGAGTATQSTVTSYLLTDARTLLAVRV